MKKAFGFLATSFALIALTTPVSAETTKDRWMQKENDRIGREAEDRAARNAGGTVGSAKAANNEAEIWRRQQQKELNERAKNLGDGKTYPPAATKPQPKPVVTQTKPQPKPVVTQTKPQPKPVVTQTKPQPKPQPKTPDNKPKRITNSGH